MGWEDWGKRLRAHMKTTKVTQDDVAEDMGVSQGTIAHWLNGRREVNLADFFRMCESARADPRFVLFETPAEIKSPPSLDELAAALAEHPKMQQLIARQRAPDEAVAKAMGRPPKAKRRRRHPSARRRKVTPRA